MYGLSILQGMVTPVVEAFSHAGFILGLCDVDNDSSVIWASSGVTGRWAELNPLTSKGKRPRKL